MQSKITALESSRLNDLERIVRNGLDTFMEVGIALREIQDERLYRAEYVSFQEYCQGVYGKSYSWAWKLMQAAEVQATVPAVSLPNEAVAREIARIPLPQRRKMVFTAFGQGGGKLTAQGIKDVVRADADRKAQASSKRAAMLPKDGTGLEIPPEMQEFWNRNEEASHILGLISKVRMTVEKWQADDDAIGRFVDRQGCIGKLRMIYEELQCSKSYAVCPKCNGLPHLSADCSDCRRRGSLPKFFWEMVPAETKALRG